MAQKFTIEIEIGNDGVQTADDIAQILYSTADKIIDVTGSDPLAEHVGAFKNVRDLNGNTVGLWQVQAI